MKKISLILTLLLMAGVLVVNAETRRVTIERNVTELNAFAGAVIKYNCSNTSSPYMLISGPTEKINNLSISQKGGSLSIGPKKNKLGSRNGNMIRGVIVTIYGRMPRDIDASSGANVTVNNTVTASSAEIDVETSSGANVTLKGLTCRSISMDASSGSLISTQNLKAETISIDSSSGSSVKTGTVNCKSISCDASSGSSITVSGNSKNGDFEASSGAAIRGAGLRVSGNCSIEKSSGGSISLAR